jgi:hypothetical protein
MTRVLKELTFAARLVRAFLFALLVTAAAWVGIGAVVRGIGNGRIW